MEQLITMKQRIKAVETIKKVTHAMRLISMSSHTRLQDKKKHLTEYKQSFEDLWNSVRTVVPPSVTTTYKKEQRLSILVGSQKGLCGTFNTGLCRFFAQKRPSNRNKDHVIGIGTYAIDYLNRRKIPQVASFTPFTKDTFIAFAQAVTDQITKSPYHYSSVTVYSNKQKTFFVQQPHETIVYPLPDPLDTTDETKAFLFEQSPEVLRETLSSLLLSVTLQDLFFDSLLSEQAARFISMDSSTRNAENLLTSLKVDYNKLRQASITRELTELSATL